MASKNTRKKIAGTLESMPVHPLTITFTSVVKKKLLEDNSVVDGVVIADLPKEVKHTITVERLEGFQYSKEFTSMMEGFEHAKYYSPAGCEVVSRGGNVVNTSLLSLTNALGRYNFMMNNAVKLYFRPTEVKNKVHIYDRNFSEICGEAFRPDDITKAYVSPTAIRLTKEDTKDTADMMTIMHTEDYENHSPVRSFKQAVEKLVTPEKLLNWRKDQTAHKASKAKAIGYK